MSQLALTSPANVCDNAGTLEQQDAARTFIIGPNVSTALFGKVWAVAATTKQIFALSWQVFFQPEDGGAEAAFQPEAPFEVLTSDGAIIFYSRVMGIEIRGGHRSQYPYPHDPALAAEFFARHRSSQ